PVYLPADAAGSADRSPHWPRFAVLGQWGRREAAASTSLARAASRRPHWPGTANRGEWGPQSAKPAASTGK
uniref:Uncharacterized protein n=1 Tax=Terrapene triunguis TaxID=2587831 RepID=A0A674IXE8_9SAUR